MEQLDYQGMIVRPPSEADSIILQATLGCSHNKCTFCPTYLDKRFNLKTQDVIAADIEKASNLYPDHHRIFIADGDAMVMPMKRWLWLLETIKEKLPNIKRVGAYATGRSIRGKSDEELRLLAELGLGIVYLGVESGDDGTLEYIKKDSTATQLIEAGRRIRAAGMKLSVTVLLGIAPGDRSLEHARHTGELLTKMEPNYVGALTVMLMDGTLMAADHKKGVHHLPDSIGLLKELREMLAATELKRALFMANHASNYLPLRVRMPAGKAEALELLDAAIEGKVDLKPEQYRAL